MAHTQPTHGTLACTTTKHLRSCTKNGTRRFPGLGDGTLARQATRLYCGAAPRARWHHHADFSGKRTFCVWRNHLWRVAVRMGKQRRCHHDRNSPPPPLPHPRMRPTLAGGNHIGRKNPVHHVVHRVLSMAGATGLEPATFGFGSRCSAQFELRPINKPVAPS